MQQEKRSPPGLVEGSAGDPNLTRWSNETLPHRARDCQYPVTPPLDPLDAEIALRLREEAARLLELHLDVVKPCWPRITGQPEGRRAEVCHLLAVEILRAGASPMKAMGFLSQWLGHCEQPPEARHAFTLREAESTVKSVARRQKSEGLLGYGCKGPLAEWCPYSDKRECAYLAHRRKVRKRESITTLAGAWRLAMAHRIPEGWTERQVWRRRCLLMAFGALEQLKGYSGQALITSERELEYQIEINRGTLRRDLAAMAAAGWIEYAPGLSRQQQGDSLSRGTRIVRLLAEKGAHRNAPSHGAHRNAPSHGAHRNEP